MTAAAETTGGMPVTAPGPQDEARRLGFRLTLPAQVLVLFISVFPLLMQLYISLTDWSPLSGIAWPRAWEMWNGFANYTDLMGDGRLWAALGRTALVMAVCVPVEFLLGLALATLFMDDFPGKRVLYSDPHHADDGRARRRRIHVLHAVPVRRAGERLLSAVLGQPVAIAWLSDPTLALIAVMVADIWQWTPLMFLILLAGLAGVPDDQLKAATLLGAGPWQRFRTIVLPRMKTIIVIALAIRVIECFKIFDTLYIMTGGGPGVATETISVYIYKITTQDLIWGYVAAIALAILIALSILCIWAMKRMAARKRGAGMSAIRLENLVKRFGAFTALKTMDLTIDDGEFMALLGPSGCGKSTTMNMIAGMEQPSEGRILFGGRDMAGVSMRHRGVGFVFQNYAIFTHMTVRRNLDYGLRMARRPAAEIARRTAAMAELLQLTDLLDRPAAGLSVNILQRVAIGRSAMMEPAIFLLDEPLSNVDAAFRAVMRTELKQLQRTFRQTMVYVTHDQLEAMTMADRIAVMDHGVLQQVGHAACRSTTIPPTCSSPASSARPA